MKRGQEKQRNLRRRAPSLHHRLRSVPRAAKESSHYRPPALPLHQHTALPCALQNHSDDGTQRRAAHTEMGKAASPSGSTRPRKERSGRPPLLRPRHRPCPGENAARRRTHLQSPHAAPRLSPLLCMPGSAEPGSQRRRPPLSAAPGPGSALA